MYVEESAGVASSCYGKTSASEISQDKANSILYGYRWHNPTLAAELCGQKQSKSAWWSLPMGRWSKTLEHLITHRAVKRAGGTPESLLQLLLPTRLKSGMHMIDFSLHLISHGLRPCWRIIKDFQLLTLYITKLRYPKRLDILIVQEFSQARFLLWAALVERLGTFISYVKYTNSPRFVIL